MQNPHPNIKNDRMTTTFRESFRKPIDRSKPNYRTRVSCGQAQFDQMLTNGYRPSTTASGYAINRSLFDGSGWVPEKNLHTDMIRTEYRNRYNPCKPFHKSQIKDSPNKLKKKELVYDIYG